MKKSINPQALEIQRRFFQALDYGIETEKIKGGLKGFCDDHKLNRVKYVNIKNDFNRDEAELKPHSYKVIDLDALAYICNDCKVSPEWLLFGRGKMRIE